MKNKTFIVKIGWCPDSLFAEDIECALEEEFGVLAEVVEE